MSLTDLNVLDAATTMLASADDEHQVHAALTLAFRGLVPPEQPCDTLMVLADDGHKDQYARSLPAYGRLVPTSSLPSWVSYRWKQFATTMVCPMSLGHADSDHVSGILF